MDTFDFKKVSTIVNGAYLTGFMDGSAVKIAKNADDVNVHVGAAGEVTYSESNDKTGMLTVTLKQNSSSLPALINLAKSKKAFPVSVQDNNNGSIKAGGNYCRITKIPDIEFGSDVAGVEISIHISDFDVTA